MVNHQLIPSLLSKAAAKDTSLKIKFSIKDLFSKFADIWSHLLKKPLIENFIFCAVRSEAIVVTSIYYIKK